MQNQIYFPSVDKCTSRLLLMKLGDIIKVEVSNISISITEDGPKSLSERELAGLHYIWGLPLCISCITILEITKTGGTQNCSKLLVLLELAGQLSPVKIRN